MSLKITSAPDGRVSLSPSSGLIQFSNHAQQIQPESTSSFNTTDRRIYPIALLVILALGAIVWYYLSQANPPKEDPFQKLDRLFGDKSSSAQLDLAPETSDFLPVDPASPNYADPHPTKWSEVSAIVFNSEKGITIFTCCLIKTSDGTWSFAKLKCIEQTPRNSGDKYTYVINGSRGEKEVQLQNIHYIHPRYQAFIRKYLLRHDVTAQFGVVSNLNGKKLADALVYKAVIQASESELDIIQAPEFQITEYHLEEDDLQSLQFNYGLRTLITFPFIQNLTGNVQGFPATDGHYKMRFSNAGTLIGPCDTFTLLTGRSKDISKEPHVFSCSSYRGELLLLDPNNSPCLNDHYEQILKGLEEKQKQKGSRLTNMDVLSAFAEYLHCHVFSLNGDRVKRLDALNEKALEDKKHLVLGQRNRKEKVLVKSLDSYAVAKIQVCRGFAFAAKYFCDKQKHETHVNRRFLDDGITLFIQENFSPSSAHAWLIYISKSQTRNVDKKTQEVLHYDPMWKITTNLLSDDGIEVLERSYGAYMSYDAMSRTFTRMQFECLNGALPSSV